MEHTHHHNHTSHQTHAMSHGSAKEYLRRFWIVTFLLIPLVATNEMTAPFFGVGDVPFSKWIGLAVATVIFGFSLVFFQHAWHEIKNRRYGMMTLVSLAVGSGYLFSVASTFIPALHAEFYLEIATLIWVLLFGHYLEARSSSRAGNALQEVAKLLPKQAHRLVDGKKEDVDIARLEKEDVVLVLPGEKIPADGVVSDGSANVDESLVSGESKPVEKKRGDQVVAGSLCLDGALTITLTRVGEHSTIGQIQTLIAEAERTKPTSQRIADRASAVLTFVAGATALVTILVWTLFLGETFVFALTLAITVLVIACPHALGLAIPTVTTITTQLAVKNGIFIKNLAKIETIRKADYVVFDKTGTLTEGEFGVTGIVPLNEKNTNDLLAVAASLEQYSSHIIGQSILKYAREQRVALSSISNFKNIAGEGVSATLHGTDYVVGNERLMRSIGLTFDVPTEVTGTLVFVGSKEKLLGYLTLADAIKQSSHEAVQKLHAMGVKVAMLTGDNEQVARDVSRTLQIDTYFANVLPREKYTYIKKLQEDGSVVLMVGDGVNDAPALTQSDAGVAIGSGTDVAVEAGDVVLMRNNPMDVVRLLKLSRAVYVKMVQNLFWALGYNVVAIPAAAGAFAHPIFFGGIFLRPEIGALLMSLSTVIVVVNALMLKNLNLKMLH
ncbi:MAG: heavy metal translocating P-type ATPase [Patescibacteria group bacterium]